jgi:UPF0755 protein
LKRLILGAFVLFVVLAAALAVAGRFAYQRAHVPFKGYDAPEQFVDLPPGASTGAIGRRLIESGVVSDRWAFRIALWESGAARRLKAGEYRFDRPMTAREVIDRIARGDVYLRSITFAEGLTIKEMAAVFEGRGFGAAGDFAAAAGGASAIRDLDPEAETLEGYLFPDTYRLPRAAGARELVGVMVSRFRQVFEPLGASGGSDRTVRQIVTLASLVEKETARAEERPLVAAVYLNRLRIGMGLQCDPTVIYALERAGRYDGNLKRSDLPFDSPYNTYRYAGLPPGPIAAPGKASLEAAVRPADVRYLYFVSRNDGSHVFAGNLAEHNRNVQRYQVQYFRRRR